ncbi:MAG: phosphoadenylyl-sulfate reductase [Herpetosiphonaceae bacterium]|nr:phosphoadenylyl-sulfate reductase [Herpetosiphonaceae bacterium]
MLDLVRSIRPTSAEIGAWNTELATATPEEVLTWGAAQWNHHMALTCSFGGPAGMVLLDMIVKVAPATPALYIDTGVLFPETYALIEQVEQHYGIQLAVSNPHRTIAEQEAVEGPALWTRDPNRCCAVRKVQPLAETLLPFDAWITGLRRDNGSTRAQAQLVEWSTKYQLVKLNPLVAWTERDVWRYIHAHKVLYNPLLDQGYTSIGCAPCTRLPTSDDPRSGRWVGFGKTECGLHLEPEASGVALAG